MLAQRARHPGAKFPAVVRHEKVLLAILPADSEAFGRPGRDLGREPPRPRAGRDEDVQLVGLAGVVPGRPGSDSSSSTYGPLLSCTATGTSSYEYRRNRYRSARTRNCRSRIGRL